MPTRAVTLRRLAPAAVLYLLADAVFFLIPSLRSIQSSYFFQLTAPLCGLGVCCWRAATDRSRARVLWWLFAAALGFLMIGVGLSAWEDLFEHFPFEIASLADFAYFFCGVPILFALSTPVEEQRFSLFNWLDAVQAVFAGYLTYVTIFSRLPFSESPAKPISVALLLITYNLENAVLLAGCTLRLLASAKGSEQRRFYGTLFAFLAAYGVGVGFYNQIAVGAEDHLAPNFLVDAPFIWLAIWMLALPKAAEPTEHDAVTKTRLALFIDLGSPVFFTLTLLTLGLVVLRQHFATGILAISVALAVYGVRTTILQIRFRQAQEELQRARDRLEELSLQDGLTGIANRRCFDRTLDSEWYRATRTGKALSLLLIDLDFFKNVNDVHGHPHGDRCLVEVAHALRGAAARSGDLVARFGGEEFAAILPGTTKEAAEMIAERIRAAVLDLKIPNETGIGSYVSVSIGGATAVTLENTSPGLLIEAADRALYKAKQLGRNGAEHTIL